MSPRVTRSAARIAAEQSSTQPNTSESTPSRPNTRSQKRRASPSSPSSELQQSAPLRRSKRQRLEEPEVEPEELEPNPASLGRARSLRGRTTMSTSGYGTLSLQARIEMTDLFSGHQTLPARHRNLMPNLPRPDASLVRERNRFKVLSSSIRGSILTPNRRNVASHTSASSHFTTLQKRDSKVR